MQKKGLDVEMINERLLEDGGLTTEQVRKRVEMGLVNQSANVTTKSVKQIVRSNIVTLFNLINVILAICVFSVGSYKNMLFMGVVISNICIGIIQEVRAKRTIDQLTLISAPKARVLRNHTEVDIAMEEIVQDDILLLKPGNQICADGIVLSGECEVNESLLTGESDPVLKKAGDELHSGSILVSGTVKARVTKIGSESYANQIIQGAKYLKKPNSEIMKSIRFFIRVITCFLIPIAFILFYKQICLVGQDYKYAIVSTVAAVIGMIPEGLVLLSSIVMAVSAVRLAKHNTLVQEMYCVETLARVDVLCLDKTGTITEGNMQVDDIVALHGMTQNIEEAIGSIAYAFEDVNPTLLAIQNCYEKSDGWNVNHTIPFSSAKKWSLVQFEQQGTYILGAAEYILGEKVEAIRPYIEEYAMKGQRVLLLAHSYNHPKDRNLPESIEAIGLVILSDKIRKEAKATLEYFQKQDVTIKIISGDDPVTVANVARRAGFSESIQYVDMSKITTKEELSQVAETYQVFGRVTPHQKLSLVQCLKENGHTVAMTGDGVNDVLALKEADCSIAMQSGSDAARNVSHLVLLDSNFASMPKVVEEGRKSINNLQRSASLFLVKTMYSFLLSLLFVFIDQEYPFIPIQLSLISSIAIGIPSFLLAMEPNRSRVNGHFLMNVIKKALPGGLLVVTNVLIVVFLSNSFAVTKEQVGTIATFVTAFAQMVVLFQVCCPFNKLRAGMYLGLATIFILQVIFLHGLYGIVPLSVNMWLLVFGLGLFSIAAYPIYSYIVKKVLYQLQ